MRCENCGTEWSISIHGSSVQKFCPVCGKSVAQPTAKQLASLEETLHVIAHDYGIGNLQDGARAVAFFSDLAPHLGREKVILQHFVRCDGNTLLISALQKTPREQQLCIKQLVSRMVNELFVSETAAQWICASFWNAIAPEKKPPVVELTPEELFESGSAKVQTDTKTAVQLITKAAEAGYFPAQAKLAKWYREGGTTDKNPAKAFFWYKKAADSGDPETQCNLGWCYATGFGCLVNPVRAADCFRKASAAGLVVAHYNLARCYEKGRGVQADASRAASLYEMAAKADHVKAQYHMGRCYESGLGVPRDIALAVFWYRKSAVNGSADAQFAMGQCYEQGNGFDQDADLAYYWYKQAANNGHTEGKRKIQKKV